MVGLEGFFNDGSQDAWLSQFDVTVVQHDTLVADCVDRCDAHGFHLFQSDGHEVHEDVGLLLGDPALEKFPFFHVIEQIALVAVLRGN